MENFTNEYIRGVVVPILTPFDSKENVDVEALKRLVGYLIGNGVHGIFILGTTGEFARLDSEQTELIAKTVKSEVGDKVPLYLGVSDCGTKKVIQNIRKAEALGADVIVSTLPYYYTVRSSYEQLAFFEAITECTSLPVMLYNIPDNTGSNILPEVVTALSYKSNVVGIKDSSGNVDYLREILALPVVKELKVFVGMEKLSMEGLLMGAHGLVPSIGNVFPRMTLELYNACIQKDEKRAALLQQDINDINQMNRSFNSPLGAVLLRKYALSLMGICCDTVSEPHYHMTQQEREQFKAVIRKYIV